MEKPDKPAQDEIGKIKERTEPEEMEKKERAMDEEFEPTADMMVNDFDDEQTLEEAEIDETAEDQRAEADLLKQEQNMPIEKLLALYGGYRTGQDEKESVVDGGGEERDDSDAEEAADTGNDPQPQSAAKAAESSSLSDPEPHATPRPAKRRRSTLSVLYPELARRGAESAAGGGDRRGLRSEEAGGAGGELEAGSSSSSEEESGSVDESSWRKTIMIGSVYQASVPAGLQPYTDAAPAAPGDQLLWRAPDSADADELVESYQRRVEAARQRLSADDSPQALPAGRHTRDCEQALFLLLQCRHDAAEAFRRWRANAEQQKGGAWPASLMTAWSEDECASFENGLRFYGKDFFTIQQQRVRTRSVGELVQFYYLWKKTERHDVFANRAKLEKRKYALTPGITDYMERFIEEQQRETSASGRAAAGSASATGAASLQVLMAPPAGPQWPRECQASGGVQWRTSLAGDFSSDVSALAGNRPAPLVPP
nr:HOX-like protein 3 [Parasacculina yatsui]